MKDILGADVKEKLKKEFETLSGDVRLLVFTRKGLNDEFNEFAVTICREFSELSDRISFEHKDADSEDGGRYGIESSPVILFNPDSYNIRFMGAPLGEEGRSFVAAIMMVSKGRGILSAPSVERIGTLKEKREILIFVTPT